MPDSGGGRQSGARRRQGWSAGGAHRPRW